MRPIIQWRHHIPHTPQDSETTGSKSYAGIPCERLQPLSAADEPVSSADTSLDSAELQDLSANLDEGLPHLDMPAATLVRPVGHSSAPLEGRPGIPPDRSTSSRPTPHPHPQPPSVRPVPVPPGLHFKRKPSGTTSGFTVYSGDPPPPLRSPVSTSDEFILDTSLLPGVLQHPLPPRPRQPQGRSPNPARRCPIRAFLDGLKPPLGVEAPVFYRAGFKTQEDPDRLINSSDERWNVGKQLVEDGLGDFYWKLVEEGLKGREKTSNVHANRGCMAFVNIKNIRC